MSADQAVPPSGVVTFLFTDIEGSTRRWEADPDAMRVALDAHNRVLRETVAAHYGKVFNYTGDGMCAVFASPRAAVDAAVAAQHAMELPVRMGIATGEAELRGGEYFGTVLNRTARVMAAGHGGQILIDGTTAGLVSGIDLMSLGTRRLRDIAKPVDVYQVQATGLRTEFPPLKTADRTPGNLRPPTTSFVGRDTELTELETALKAHRLLTLTGVGGVGKTRLALELASRSAENFPDGVFVMELAAVGDPAAVPEAAAAVLGVTQQRGLSVAESVAAALEGRSRLLVFDNCEHVLDAAANMIETILSHSSTVKVLATSREGLRLADEQLWPVPSLVTTGVDSAAATLFVERAQAVAPTIALAGSDDAGAVVEICQRLDGIPLGIELAASRLQSMTVTDVRDRLDDRFRLLVGSRRGLERHQTLRHAVQWSFDLLEDAEKSVLATCSVFAGGFDIDGACAVTGSGDEFATLDLLDALTRKSLLIADRTSAHARFSMLETIRQFAEEHLVASGEGDDARNAHAKYFSGREADVLALWDSPRQSEAYNWLNIELANLRTAFRWAADNHDLDTAAPIAIYATFLGFFIGQFEPARWAEELIESAKAVDHRRLAQLYAMAAQCYSTGRVDDALRFSDALHLAVESGRFDEVPFEFEALLGGTYVHLGEPERWAELCRKMIEREPGAHPLTRSCLAIASTSAGADDEAISASEALLTIVNSTDNPLVACFTLLAYWFVRRHSAPLAAYEGLGRGLRIAHDSGNEWVESQIAINLSRLAAIDRDPTDSFNFLVMSIRYYHDSGNVSLIRQPLAALAVFFDRLGYYEKAAIISGFAATPLVHVTLPEFQDITAHLREVLGDEYESFAGAGKDMTNAQIVSYAFEQIDQARAELNAVSK
jgi:predicted ATPase/class 3 adenylate cyclase